MRPVFFGWSAACVVVGVTAVAVGTLSQRLWRRHAELARARVEHREWVRLRAERDQLRAEQAAPDELATLRADRQKLGELRREVALVRASEAQTGRAVPAGIAAPELNRIVPVAAWANRGYASDTAALETVLWAASAGEVDALARGLVLEPDARVKAQALFDALPPEARATHGSPERLVALLTAKAVPLGSMQIVAAMTQRDGDRLLRVRLQAVDGSARTTTIAARQGADGWRLVVPAGAVARLADTLAR